jgi:hypothetical protein
VTIETLGLINDGMTELGLEYQFGAYDKRPIVYPYWVGEYQEFDTITEDGLQETTVILNGFSRGSWLDLERDKTKIENYFGRVSAKTVITDSGSGVAVSFSDALIVPTGDAELKRMQINLKVQEWKVN